MKTIKCKLTVYFAEPFWVGVFERICDGKLSVAKVTFGAEPKDYDIQEFVLKEYKIQDEINQHRNAANALWDIRESYISLLTDYDILENDDIRHQRDVLCKKVSEVNNNYPATDSKSYRAAQKALKKDEEQTFKEGEIDSILPNRIG